MGRVSWHPLSSVPVGARSTLPRRACSTNVRAPPSCTAKAPPHLCRNEHAPSKGRQMPDHYGSRVARFTSISSPVGTQITQAAGFAWAAKIKKEDVATLVYFGEGATSSGEFHNGLNFAGVFKAPVVLFCR